MAEEAKVEAEDWATETGLVNDVDVWFKNCKFGFKDEYKAVAGVDAPMFVADMVNEEGEVIASQGYSVGTGWLISDDGLSISHPTRKNVVGSSVYGQLINKVIKDLKVNMAKYGRPTDAKSWEGLGFHVIQEEHKTLSGDTKTAPMPSEFLGEKEYKAPVVGKDAPTTTTAPASPIETKLAALAGALSVADFQKAALKLAEVTKDDDLMALVLDDSKEGFWAKHQES